MVNPSLNDLYQRLKTADHPLPGGKIGKEIGVTKVAVWKMIGRLEDLGVHIQRSAKGYRLQERDPLHPFSFPGCQEKVHYSRETTSTMAAARELAQQRLWGHLAVAERQSQGRDRSGGAWNSPVGGLYLTVVLRPENSSLTDALTLGLRFLLELVEKLPLSAEPGLQVRWPGDLIYQGKKVGGVLLEGAGDNREWQYCCLGLGSVSPIFSRIALAP
jgi:BirA family biotin operon repressor/biotin-[acetyl-CoA-carboxylase] ligase